jgi:pimeloyl-ACP methyl ester carboxylesterase
MSEMDGALIRRAVELAAADPEFALHAADWTGAIYLGTPEATWRVRIAPAGPSGPDVADGVPPLGPGDLAAVAAAPLWRQMLQPVPPAPCTNVFGASLAGLDLRMGGMDGRRYLAVSRFCELLRHAANGTDPAPQVVPSAAVHGQLDHAVGRYVHLLIDGVDYRVYYEEAGTGIGLLCQHTAGADARQWRHLLEDERITSRFRVIAYDLPFHGKSVPPAGQAWWTEPHRLTTSFVLAVVRALSGALGLDRPAFVGSSLGGMLALDLARFHPDEFRAVIACEGALKFDVDDWIANLPPSASSVLSLGFRPDVALHAATQTPFMGATAPAAYRKETWWHYAQGGPGIFPGDMYYYATDHDLRDSASQIDTSRCAVHFLTGEYDYPSLDISAASAGQIAGATHAVMKGLGHFPMSEDPDQFASYLLPILDGIAGDEQ